MVPLLRIAGDANVLRTRANFPRRLIRLGSQTSRNPVLQKLLYFQSMSRNLATGLPIIELWSGDTLDSKRASIDMGFVR